MDRYQADPTSPGVPGALRDLVVRAVAPAIPWGAFLALIGWVIVHPLNGLTSEEAVNRWLQTFRNPTLDQITYLISESGSTWQSIGLTIVCVIVLAMITRRWWEAVIPGIAVSIQASVFVLVTWFTDRPRPSVPRLDEAPPTSSYPSGHTGACVALYWSLMLFAMRIPNPLARRVLVTFFAVFPILMGVVRLYRGMHHLTDVILGFANGAVAVWLAWHYLRRTPDQITA